MPYEPYNMTYVEAEGVRAGGQLQRYAVVQVELLPENNTRYEVLLSVHGRRLGIILPDWGVGAVMDLSGSANYCHWSYAAEKLSLREPDARVMGTFISSLRERMFPTKVKEEGEE